MREKVILINPAYLDSSLMIRRSAWVAMPMGLLYLAAVLEKEGHCVKIIDMQAKGLTKLDINRIIEEEKPSVVGLTATTPVIKLALELSLSIKEINEDIKIVLGGPHPTHLPLEALGAQSVDIVVRGEGENTICELIDVLMNNPDTLDQVKGIVFNKNNKPVFTGERSLINNLDTLPFPAWHLIDMGAYHHPLSRSKRFASVLTSRGCPSSCTFCSRGVFSHKYRKRSAKNIIEEIQMLISHYNIEEVHFIDDNFTLDCHRLEEICNEVIQKGLNFKWATPNGVSVVNLDRDLLPLMKKSGCYALSFGVESGNQETLDYIKKGQSLSKVKEIFSICHTIGIETVAFVIIGFPNEGRREIDKTLHFLKEIRADIADIHTLIPLPGTEMYDELDKKGFILEKNWNKYVFHDLPVYKTEHFSPKEIAHEYKRLYRAYHLRSAYIFSRLMQMKSWEELKNNIGGLITLLTMSNKA